MSLTIHLGAHKTATTHLQASWRAAALAMLRRGLYYAGPIDLRQQRCPLTLALGDPPGSRKAARAQVHFDRVREVYPEILISDENILGGTQRANLFGSEGQVYPEAEARLDRLLAILGNRPAVVALAVRDPARFLVSAFSLQVMRGAELDLAAYLNGRAPWAMDWTGLARRILALPQVTRLVVWRYEDYRALRPRISARLLPAALAAQVSNPRPVNVGLSQQGYDWMIAQAMQNSEADLRDLAGQARLRFARRDGHAPLDLLSAQELERSASGYAGDIARLRQLPGVEFLAP